MAGAAAACTPRVGSRLATPWAGPLSPSSSSTCCRRSLRWHARPTTWLRRQQAAILGRVPGLVFLSPSGRPLDSATGRKALRRLLKRVGIARRDEAGWDVDVHALRTSAITRLLRHGAPVAVVAEIVGHADVRLTMRHDTDLRVEDLRGAMDAAIRQQNAKWLQGSPEEASQAAP